MVLLRTGSNYLARVGALVHWREKQSRSEVSQVRLPKSNPEVAKVGIHL